MPGPTHKRLAQPIFIRSWCFTKKANSRVWIANAENGLRPSRSQFFTPRALDDLASDYVQRRGALLRRNSLFGSRRIK